MNQYIWTGKSGINRSPAFAEKKLADFAVNCGTKCDHGCTYCSTGSMMRMHESFHHLGLNPFKSDYAIIDPETPIRVAHDARHKRQRGLIQLCTITDAWSPAAHSYRLGRQCLAGILAEPGWTVRILTKNASVQEDFDLIQTYSNRILLGLSLTATPNQEALIRCIEPQASPITERLAAMQQAYQLGLRTYAILCPLLPGIADAPDQIDELVRTLVQCGVEEIFAEAVNSRGPGLKLTQQALEDHGFDENAAQIAHIRQQARWSHYVRNLVKNIQTSIRRHYDINQLRFLLYPSRLLAEDRAAIEADDAGVIWLA